MTATTKIGSTIILTIIASLSQHGCCGRMCEAHNNALEDMEDDDEMTGGGVDLLTIELPFAQGYNSLCTQGANGSYSHHSTSTRYDVDLDTPNDRRDPVYAPVGGIAYAHDESRTANYGEHVTIDVGDGTYIILAHLDDIFIGDGEEVAAGQLVGYEGTTGLSVGDHVHIGRHSGDAALKGEYGTSVNALAFTAYDTSIGAVVTETTEEMTCDLSTGHVYESTLPTPLWHPTGSLLMVPGVSTVYVLEGTTLRPFLNETAFTSRNYDWDDIALVGADELDCYIAGEYVSGTSMVTAVYDSAGGTGAWLLVGSPTESTRYRSQVITSGASAVLATWGISASDTTSLPSPESLGVSLSSYPATLETATFREGSLVSTTERSDVYVMEGGAAIPILDWDTYLLMGFRERTVHELAQRDFDVLVSIVGDCVSDSYCIAQNDVTTCGGDTEDVPGTYPGEGTGGADDGDDDGAGLELWWWLDDEADWITISGQFTNENDYDYAWNNNIAWSTWSDTLYFSIVDAGPGDSFRYSYAFFQNGEENWSCLGPFPPGDLTGTAMATYNGAELTVYTVADPGSDGCGLLVEIPE